MAKNYAFIGVGKVYIKEFGVAGATRELGNVTGLNFAVSEETKEVKNSQTTGGGTYAELRRVESVEATINITDYSPENIAMTIFGSTTALSAGTETDEVQRAYHGGHIDLDKLLDAITDVNSAASGAGTSYVEDTDYIVTPNGIDILSTGSIVDDSDLYITYTTLAGSEIQALVNSAKEYVLVFEGLNEAQSGKKVVVTVHKCKMGATTGLDWISDDFGNLEASGKILADTTKTGSLSQYFSVKEAA